MSSLIEIASLKVFAMDNNKDYHLKVDKFIIPDQVAPSSWTASVRDVFVTTTTFMLTPKPLQSGNMFALYAKKPRFA